MIARTFKGAIHVLAGVAAGLAIMLLLLAWQLSKGPISLGVLSPYIENAVNEGQPNFKLKMRDTILTWAGWERSLDIRVLDVEILNNQNEMIGSVPELSFSLNRKALLEGELAPDTIEVFGPKLRIIRQKNGSFNIGFGGAKDVYASSALRVLQELLEGPKGNHPLRSLNRLHIISADMTVDDQILETSWLAPSADIRLSRDDLGVQGQISLILDVEGKQTELELLGRYKSADKELEVTADVDQISLAPFSPFFEDIEFFKNFRVPLKGMVAMSIPITGGATSIRFDVSGGAGQLDLPDPLSQTLNVKSVAIVGEYSSVSEQVEIEDIRLQLAANQLQLPAPFSKTLNLDSLILAGAYSGKTGIAQIKELKGELGANGRVYIPPPVDHSMPLRWFSLKGKYDSRVDQLVMSEFIANLGGPQVSIKGTVSNALKSSIPIDIDIETEINDALVNDVALYWPRSFGPDAYDWVTNHLADGTLHRLKAKSQLKIAKNAALKIESLNGTMRLSGVSVDYLSPLPKGIKVNGDIVFDQNSMNIKLTHGKIDGLTLQEGTVRLFGLNEVNQYADIDLTIDGSLQSKLAFIDKKPLGFASGLGIDPNTASGQSRTDLSLKFPIEHSLTFKRIKIEATSKLTGVSLDKVFLGRGIHDSALELKIDNKGMTVTGEVNFEEIPAQLVWRENFEDNRAYRSRYDLAAVIKDVKKIRDLGLDMQPFSDDYLSGAIGANIRFTVFGDVDRRLEVSADVTDAALHAPGFGWSKKIGVAGRSEIVIDLERDVVVDIPRFSIKAGDLNIKGAVTYAPKGTHIERIEFDRIAFGRTDVKGALIAQDDGGWDIGLHGPSFDFSTYWEELFSGEPGDQGKEILLPNLTMAIEIDRVWVNESDSMENVSGTFSYKGDIWQTFLLSSRLDSGASFDLSIRPRDDGNRNILVTSDNAGDALRFLDAYDTMQGGVLKIIGTYDDAAHGRPLTGILTVNDYRIVDAPALAHVLNIMALTGILDALSGDGIGFNLLEAPFSYHDGVVELKDARASGTSLGFTAKGHIYRHADVVDISGTVVPAYALNSAFGHIPVLGALLTGGEKGGGVFAANYSMSGSLDEPEISVNPLSALTPGFLRNVFGVFDDSDKDTKFTPGKNLKISMP